jgi:hypothetical protein
VNESTPASRGRESTPDSRSLWSLALDRMSEALALLDRSNAPPEIGAELDLALNRLQDVIDRHRDA